MKTMKCWLAKNFVERSKKLLEKSSGSSALALWATGYEVCPLDVMVSKFPRGYVGHSNDLGKADIGKAVILVFLMKFEKWNNAILSLIMTLAQIVLPIALYHMFDTLTLFLHWKLISVLVYEIKQILTIISRFSSFTRKVCNQSTC